MHPTDVDPGVTLAGRYRVAELLAEAPGDSGVAQTWRAVDEVLSRSVVVHVLAADDPRAPALLEASRRAATVTDARFIRVLDAMGEDGVVYVVREWVQGRNLGALLADGPLPPRNAGLIVREVAEALASAHAQGLTHERLDPASLVITDAGSIKIVGLATQRALTSGGEPSTDPARADSLGLGRLLYAGLTARWPAGPRCGLEAALRAGDGTLLSPRQCLAGIPKALDEITERILSDHPRHGTPLTTPEQVAEALIEAVGITPPEGVLPQTGPPPSNSALGGYPPPAPPPGPALDPAVAETTAVRPAAPMEHPPMPPRHPGGGYLPPPAPAYDRAPGTRLRRGLTLGVGVVLFLGLILLGVQLTRMAFDTNTAGDTPTPTESEESPPEKTGPTPGTPHQIQAAQDYDPSPGSDGEEHPDEVDLSHDGDPSTVWTTMAYRNNPELGGLKDGVGIWFDLGEPKQVGSVDLTLLEGGTDLQLMAAPEDASSAPESIDGWQSVAEATGAGGSVTLKPDEPVTTRYILVWFTKLPHEDGVDYRGGIAEIVVRR